MRPLPLEQWSEAELNQILPLPVSARSEASIAEAADPAIAAATIRRQQAQAEDEVAAALWEIAATNKFLGGDVRQSVLNLLARGPLNDSAVNAARKLFYKSLERVRYGNPYEGLIALDLLRWVAFPDQQRMTEQAIGVIDSNNFETCGDAFAQLFSSQSLGEQSDRFAFEWVNRFPENRRQLAISRLIQQRGIRNISDVIGRFIAKGDVVFAKDLILLPETAAHMTGDFSWIAGQYAHVLLSRYVNPSELERARLAFTSGQQRREAYDVPMETALAIIRSGRLGELTRGALEVFLAECEKGAGVLSLDILFDLGQSRMLANHGFTREILNERYPRIARSLG